MNLSLLIGCCLLAASIVRADEASLQFDQANQLYRNGDFQKAAQSYERIIGNGFESPALYYNLGNSYFKLHNIPAAILNYERARRLAPHDDDIAYNLRLCNLRVIDKIEAIPSLFFVEWWHSFVNAMSSDRWAMSGIVLMWCAVASASAFMISRSMLIRRVLLPFSFLFLIAGIFSVVSMTQRAQAEQSEQQAIVFSLSAPVKSAPDPQSTDLFVLHEGVKVEMTDSVANWKKIRLPDGKVGWISSDTVQGI